MGRPSGIGGAGPPTSNGTSARVRTHGDPQGGSWQCCFGSTSGIPANSGIVATKDEAKAARSSSLGWTRRHGIRRCGWRGAGVRGRRSSGQASGASMARSAAQIASVS